MWFKQWCFRNAIYDQGSQLQVCGYGSKVAYKANHSQIYHQDLLAGKCGLRCQNIRSKLPLIISKRLSRWNLYCRSYRFSVHTSNRLLRLLTYLNIKNQWRLEAIFKKWRQIFWSRMVNQVRYKQHRPPASFKSHLYLFLKTLRRLLPKSTDIVEYVGTRTGHGNKSSNQEGSLA